MAEEEKEKLEFELTPEQRALVDAAFEVAQTLHPGVTNAELLVRMCDYYIRKTALEP